MSDQLGVLRGRCPPSQFQTADSQTRVSTRPGILRSPTPGTGQGPSHLPSLLGSQAQVSPCSASSSRLASTAGELEADLSYKGVCFNLIYLCRVSHGVLLIGLVGAGLSLSTAPSTALQAAAYVRAYSMAELHLVWMAHAVFLLLGRGQWVSVMHTVSWVSVWRSPRCAVTGQRLWSCLAGITSVQVPCMDNNVTLPLPIPGVLDDAGVALGPDPTP